MPGPSSNAVTVVLKAVAAGDREAAAKLLPLVYDELRRLARQRMARLRPGQTLQATALVHEAYLKVVDTDDPGWDGRGHFFAAAAGAMREIIVDQVRRRNAAKRGGDRRRADLADIDVAIEPPGTDVLALDEALRELEASDPRAAAVVNLRFFAGLTAQETAGALGVSLGTVEREWRFARSWLHRSLSKLS